MVALTEARRKQYESQWASMTIPAAKMTAAQGVARIIEENKARYLEVEKATLVPWFAVALWHWREASGRFDCYLGNGQKLNQITTIEPHHRGPFKDFLAGAIDVIQFLGLDKVTDWSIGSLLFHTEEFNGEGYHNHGLPSPYVFAGSSVYVKGKYDKDGHFVSSLVDTQLGCAVLLKALISLDFVTVDQKPAIKEQKPMADTTSPAVVKAAAGTTISTTSLFTSLTSLLGGGIITTAATVLTWLAPTQAVMVVGVLGVVGGLITSGSTFFGLLHLNTATIKATFALAEKVVNTALVDLGGKAQDFDHDGTINVAT